MFSKYGVMVFSVVLGIAMAVGSVMTPCVAHAQIKNAQSGIVNDVQDCTTGCYISTCNGNTCTVWYCNSAGCKIVGGYTKGPPAGGGAMPAEVGKLAVKTFDDVAYIKTCAGDRCQLYQLTATKATKVGYVDNIEQILRELRAKHEAGVG